MSCARLEYLYIIYFECLANKCYIEIGIIKRNMYILKKKKNNKKIINLFSDIIIMYQGL